MNLQHIRQFLAVAEAGSIRGAARSLHLSQPAVTKGVQQLERELGVPLLQRNVTGAMLTSFGRAFRSRALLIAGEVTRAQDELVQLAGQGEGELAIGVAPSVATLLVPRVVGMFRRRYPDVRLRIAGGLPNSSIPRVYDGSLDLVVGPRPRSEIPASIRAWPLFEMPIAVTVRKGHARRNARSLRDFADADWILTGAAAQPQSPLNQAFAALGLPPPRSRIQADSFLAAQILIAESDYVSLMPRSMVQTGPFTQKLAFVDVPEIRVTNSVELFHRMEPPLTPAGLYLAECFMTCAAGLDR